MSPWLFDHVAFSHFFFVLKSQIRPKISEYAHLTVLRIVTGIWICFQCQLCYLLAVNSYILCHFHHIMYLCDTLWHYVTLCDYFVTLYIRNLKFSGAVPNKATILNNQVSKFTTASKCLVSNTRKYLGHQKVNFFVLYEIRLKIWEYVHLTVTIISS